jgi:hypothetical protein
MNPEQKIDHWLWQRLGTMNGHAGARDKFIGMYQTLMSLRDRRRAAA